MPCRPGISQEAFYSLEEELLTLIKRLSNRQLMELADDIHASLRERRSRLIPATPVVPVLASLNDNRRDLRRR